jgi:MFS family permease
MARRWQVLLVTSVAVFMSFLDVTIVNIAFPDISASFPGSTLNRLSWILNAYTIVFAAALVPAGRLAIVSVVDASSSSACSSFSPPQPSAARLRRLAC